MKNQYCLNLHKHINNLPVYHWDEIHTIPFENGIYFVFEIGEMYHDYRRIVRVGTHTAQNRLKGRLKDHFGKENHNSSIFIKNIGRVYIHEEQPEYLYAWDKRRNRLSGNDLEFFDSRYDSETEKRYETRASLYLRENMSLSVIPINDAKERMDYEGKIIATLNQTDDFSSSDKWIGLKSPMEYVRESGMWLTQGLNVEPLSEKQYENLMKIITHAEHFA